MNKQKKEVDDQKQTLKDLMKGLGTSSKVRPEPLRLSELEKYDSNSNFSIDSDQAQSFEKLLIGNKGAV